MDLLKLHAVTTKLLNRVDNIEKVSCSTSDNGAEVYLLVKFVFAFNGMQFSLILASKLNFINLIKKDAMSPV